MLRRKSKKVRVGRVEIGDDAPVSIESMTNTDTKNVPETLKQINELEKIGCDIIRMAIYDNECAKSLQLLKMETVMPLVADIHFDYRLAIASIEGGADKIRINPGNIGKKEGVRSLVAAAKEHNTPIRIGVNSGSIKRDYMIKYGNTAKALVESALEHVSILEAEGYHNIVLSLKSSDVTKTVEATRQISQITNYPLHIGITEAGTLFSGSIKSAVGIGALLLEGIGDTLRVSLTAPPVEEVKVALEILKCLGLRKAGVEIVSCPTCARCGIDIISIANTLHESLSDIKTHVKVAVMGCAVNGPGEAKDADIGIAGGQGKAVLFKNGQIVGTLPFNDIVETLSIEVRKMVDNGSCCHNTGV